MYDVQIETSEFKGKRTILQHRMVNEVWVCFGVLLFTEMYSYIFH